MITPETQATQQPHQHNHTHTPLETFQYLTKVYHHSLQFKKFLFSTQSQYLNKMGSLVCKLYQHPKNPIENKILKELLVSWILKSEFNICDNYQSIFEHFQAILTKKIEYLKNLDISTKLKNCESQEKKLWSKNLQNNLSKILEGETLHCSRFNPYLQKMKTLQSDSKSPEILETLKNLEKVQINLLGQVEIIYTRICWFSAILHFRGLLRVSKPGNTEHSDKKTEELNFTDILKELYPKLIHQNLAFLQDGTIGFMVYLVESHMSTLQKKYKGKIKFRKQFIQERRKLYESIEDVFNSYWQVKKLEEQIKYFKNGDSRRRRKSNLMAQLMVEEANDSEEIELDPEPQVIVAKQEQIEKSPNELQKKLQLKFEKYSPGKKTKSDCLQNGEHQKSNKGNDCEIKRCCSLFCFKSKKNTSKFKKSKVVPSSGSNSNHIHRTSMNSPRVKEVLLSIIHEEKCEESSLNQSELHNLVSEDRGIDKGNHSSHPILKKIVSIKKAKNESNIRDGVEEPPINDKKVCSEKNINLQDKNGKEIETDIEKKKKRTPQFHMIQKLDSVSSENQKLPPLKVNKKSDRQIRVKGKASSSAPEMVQPTLPKPFKNQDSGENPTTMSQEQSQKKANFEELNTSKSLTSEKPQKFEEELNLKPFPKVERNQNTDSTSEEETDEESEDSSKEIIEESILKNLKNKMKKAYALGLKAAQENTPDFTKSTIEEASTIYEEHIKEVFNRFYTRHHHLSLSHYLSNHHFPFIEEDDPQHPDHNGQFLNSKDHIVGGRVIKTGQRQSILRKGEKFNHDLLVKQLEEEAKKNKTVGGDGSEGKGGKLTEQESEQSERSGSEEELEKIENFVPRRRLTSIGKMVANLESSPEGPISLMKKSQHRKSSEELKITPFQTNDTSPYEGFGSRAFVPDSVSEIFDLDKQDTKISKDGESAPPVEIMKLKTSWITSKDALYDSRNPRVYQKSQVTNQLQQNHHLISRNSIDQISSDNKLFSSASLNGGGIDSYPRNMKYEAIFYQELFTCGFKGKHLNKFLKRS